jgi:hypothetical protein
VSDVIALHAGGSVSNAASGTITSTATLGASVYITGASGTVTNAGRIAGIDYGVDLGDGGTVANTGRYISAVRGVNVSGGVGIVTNSGTIKGTTSFGVKLNAGGQVSNAAGGVITGPFGVEVYSAAGTVTNNGTISGTSDAVVFHGTGANRLVVDPAAVFSGAVLGSTAWGSTNTLELAGGSGTVSALSGGSGTVTANAHSWAIKSFATVDVDAGASWTLSGPNNIATILNSGTLVQTGSVDISASIDPTSTGVFQLNGQTLEVAAATGPNTQISFAGGGRLTIDNTASFGTGVGTGAYAGLILENFSTADTIDLKTLSVVGVVLNYNSMTGILQVSNSASQEASLEFQASSLGVTTFQETTDGSTGIFITGITPAASTVTEELLDDTGSSSTDNITSNPALTGTAPANTTVTLTQASAAGVWTFTPSGLSQGSNTIVATDGTASASLTFTYDSIPPAVTEALVSDTGSSSTDKITADDALTGTGDPNLVVTLTEGVTFLGTTTANGSGVWTFTPASLAQGTNTIVATETDIAGNTGTASLTFTYDSVPPTVTESLVNNIGTGGQNVSTNGALTGTADPNAVVTLSEGTTALGTTTASASGVWTFTPTGLSQGTNTIVASETNVAGVTGSASLTFTLQGTTAATSVPTYSHIVVVIEENHNYDEIIGNSQAPYINSLANGGALLTNYDAVSHPSEPNYFAMYAGDTFGVTADVMVSEPDPTLATILQGAGKTFVGYVEHPDASFDHNPWESFPEGTSVEQDFANFPTGNYAALPTVSFVIRTSTTICMMVRSSKAIHGCRRT